MATDWTENETIDEFFARRLEKVRARLARRTQSEIIVANQRRLESTADMWLASSGKIGHMGLRRRALDESQDR